MKEYKYNKTAKVQIDNFSNVEVNLHTKTKEAYATDGFFYVSAHLDEKGMLWVNGNDISTNYLEIAIAKAFQELKEKVIGINGREYLTPYPNNEKKFTIRSIEQVEGAL
jgi:hypothetical protein